MNLFFNNIDFIGQNPSTGSLRLCLSRIPEQDHRGPEKRAPIHGGRIPADLLELGVAKGFGPGLPGLYVLIHPNTEGLGGLGLHRPQGHRHRRGAGEHEGPGESSDVFAFWFLPRPVLQAERVTSLGAICRVSANRISCSSDTPSFLAVVFNWTVKTY